MAWLSPPTWPSASFGIPLSTELQQTALDAVQPLSDARFLETHVAFETSSSQQGQIRKYLMTRPPHPGGSIWSVGCGSGILDLPILKAWSGSGRRFLGLEPNELQCESMRQSLGELELDGRMVASTLEDFESEERFDLIWLVHAHYYFQNVPEGLARVARHLQTEGELILVSAPREALNRLADMFWAPQDERLWFTDALEAHFERRGVEAQTHRIDGRLEVGPCFEGTARGDAIRDFVVQADTLDMSLGLRGHIDEALRGMSRIEADGRITVPHPADVFVLDAENARRLVS
ncbi:MAG: class I SAM-dependent methyltransferase [Myxococcota bacterium]